MHQTAPTAPTAPIQQNAQGSNANSTDRSLRLKKYFKKIKKSPGHRQQEAIHSTWGKEHKLADVKRPSVVKGAFS